MTVKEFWYVWRDEAYYNTKLKKLLETFEIPYEISVLEELTRLDIMRREFFASLEEDYFERILSENKKLENSLSEEMTEEFKKEARINFLESESLNIANELKKIYDRDEELANKKIDSFTRSIILFVRKEPLLKNTLKKYVAEKKYRLMSKNEGKLTDEMISIARNYPMNKLIEFDVNGFARCLFHEEKTPSMSHWKKKNLVRCFGCGKVADSIDVFMKITGRNFVDAVKALSSL